MSASKQTASSSESKPRGRARRPRAFLSLVLAGMLFRAVALLVTAFVLSDGSGTEGNPLYHSVSALYFVIFMFMSMAIVYGILWAVPMSSRLRLFLGSIVTVGSGYDMIHDIFYLFYQQDPIVYLWYHYV